MFPIQAEWVMVILGAISLTGTGLAIYVRSLVQRETRTLRVRNGGAHLADVPYRLNAVEARMDAMGQTVEKVSKTQDWIVQHLLERGKHNGNKG